MQPDHASGGVLPVPPSQPKLRLGEHLMQQRLLTDEQLRRALAIQARTGERLGHILRAFGLVRSNDLYRSLSALWHLPFVRIANVAFDVEMCHMLPFEEAARLHCVPVLKRGGSISVATAEQPVAETERIISDRYGAERVVFCVTTEREVDAALWKIYGVNGLKR